MPALFIGHGNPMNAMEDTEYARAWQRIGESLRRPKAVLAISAHWDVEGTFVTAVDNPRTIHDFGGFPPALNEVRYPAPDDPELAARVQRIASRANVLPDTSWGIDHGAWSVLRRLFPDADVPVVQLSLDEAQPPAFHHELGRQIAASATKACSCWGAATSSTIWKPIRGVSIPLRRSGGRRASSSVCVTAS